MAYCGPTSYRPVAEWVPASNGSVPPNAIEVGYDGGDIIYVGRAHHQGDNIPGKLVPSHGSCYVAWGGEEHACHSYEVLVAPYGVTLEWRFASGSDLPPGAIQGGSTIDGEPLFIGRVNHEGAMCSGKVHPSHGVLYVPYGGAECPHDTFEVLVARTINF
ncbi:DUF3421 domain-containing protein [Trichonephila inaurata madagascariensis]|uniref:DUF3421 domain-containing protein n=1 Tax=Trichonephila inaurata madagascariensis TaxID=2747483 RepID=A0A8X7CTN0_9ARAC|nr:DUF3421 domain-containing protein [Trichonephila inaurata madagascariensis]